MKKTTEHKNNPGLEKMSFPQKTLNIKRNDLAIVIQFPIKRIDSFEVNDFIREELLILLNTSKDRIFIIDLSGIELIDSMGLRCFLECIKILASTGGKMKLAGLNWEKVDIFKVTKLESLFDFYDNVEAAQEAIQRENDALNIYKRITIQKREIAKEILIIINFSVNRIDTVEAEEFIRHDLLKIFKSSYKYFILDLSNIEWIDSTGLRIFIEGFKILNNKKGKMKLIGTNVSDIQIFKVTRLDSLFDFHDTVEEAVSDFEVEFNRVD